MRGRQLRVRPKKARKTERERAKNAGASEKCILRNEDRTRGRKKRRGWRGRIYHSKIPKSAQCERHERAERERSRGRRNETRCGAGRFMDGDGGGEGGGEGGGKGPGGKPRRETVFVSQVSRAVHGHGDRPAD